MSSLSGNFDDIIFSFEFNTPRFSLLRISLQKLKKLTARIEITGTASEEFIFHQSDKFAWNEADLTLYIFTTQYRMYEVKINLNEFKEETVVLEECEYLQQNIVDSSFVYVPGYGLLSFGGTLKGPQNTIAFNLDIYKYNKEKLTWVAVSSLSSPLVDPKLTISSCKRYVYLFAGDCDEGSPLFKMQVYDVEDNKVNILVDKAMKTPFLNDEAYFIRVFELSDNVFLVWHVSSSSFFLKVFSLMICGYEIDLEGKTYIDECTNLKDVSVSFVDNTIHFLRPYGRYTAIKIDKLETTNCTNKTLYN